MDTRVHGLMNRQARVDTRVHGLDAQHRSRIARRELVQCAVLRATTSPPGNKLQTAEAAVADGQDARNISPSFEARILN
ncbi:hypothetical protein [Amycolatopsis taiwanensis]|uniref:hypothetical protein n=1 Tax=Amycolatopsis taiwanensis TaxID=342230 RepID=UPI0004812BF0|nr:hypothetical protein [Amycolatopsis taiwanensis]